MQKKYRNSFFYLLKLDPKRKQEKYIVSFLRVIAVIKEVYPDIDIENIGETDFILSVLLSVEIFTPK